MAVFTIKKWRKKAISMFGKARGLTEAQRKKVTKAVWGKTNKPASTKSTPTEKRKKRMAPKKKKTRKRGFGLTSIFKYLRLGAFVAPMASRLMTPADNATKIDWIMQDYTGYSLAGKNFEASRLMKGWMPFVMTNLITYGIGKLNGIIRRM